MIVFGAVDVAAALTRLAAFLGFHVTVCDARPAFATAARFPRRARGRRRLAAPLPERTTVGESTVLTVLTHDPKFDVPLLEVALRGPRGVVGAMGSRRTHADGWTDCARTGSARTPWRACAHPSAWTWGPHPAGDRRVDRRRGRRPPGWGTGRPLRDTPGRIHHEPFAAVVAGAAESCA